MKDLGYVVIEPIVVRKKRKKSKSNIVTETSIANTGTCLLPKTKKIYTMQPGGVRIFENDLSESLWCIESRLLECECTLEKDEEYIPFKQYADEISKVKQESAIYTGNTPKLKL